MANGGHKNRSRRAPGNGKGEHGNDRASDTGIVGRFGRDQAFFRPLAEFLRMFASPLGKIVGDIRSDVFPHPRDRTDDDADHSRSHDIFAIIPEVPHSGNDP
ncbi:MAG: hypothetical protein H6Q43_958, partial [Deltaproteobacteria bacterium]|nr:hypothetical protein [Deltaproteobacteria bacterium]